jgi:hypothetical protein
LEYCRKCRKTHETASLERDADCWHLVPLGDENHPVASIVPNDDEGDPLPQLRYRAEVAFAGHHRRQNFRSVRRARHWVEQTLADWVEWRGCEIKKRFGLTERQRGIATTIIVGGGLGAFALIGLVEIGRSVLENGGAPAKPLRRLLPKPNPSTAAIPSALIKWPAGYRSLCRSVSGGVSRPMSFGHMMRRDAALMLKAGASVR